MGNFRTDDDYTPVGGDNYPPNPDPGYGGYDNPEIGDYPGRYGAVKKKSIISRIRVISRILDALGNAGSGTGNSIRNGLTLEGVLIGVYVIALVLIVLNLSAVLDFLFYATLSILQYVVMIAVVVFLGYIFCKCVLHI